MPIDVDDVLTNSQLDEYLGGQVEGATTLRPAAWSDSKPARQWGLDEVVRILRRAHPTIAESDLDATSASLKRAVTLCAVARLYELAMTNTTDPSVFYHLADKYLKRAYEEIRALGDEINAAKPAVDTRGRGRRSVVLVRR